MYYTNELNYDISGGDYTSPDTQLRGPNIMVTAVLAGITVGDMKLALEQSIDKENWGDVPDSEVVISAGQTSQNWNVVGLIKDAYLRLRLTAGSAVSGTLSDFKVLSHDD